MPRLVSRPLHLLTLLSLIVPMFAVTPPQASAETYAQESNYAVQLVYVRPMRTVDRRLFSDQQILDSVDAGQRWLEEQTAGRRINLIQIDGVPTIADIVLSRTELELRENEYGPTNQIEWELRSLGFNKPGVIYAAYYEGEADYTALCGQASSPEGFPGNTVVLYLQSWCRDYEFAGPGEDAGERDLVFIHELFHAFGAVPSCAPNLLEGGHVENSHDLMVGDGYPYQFPVLLDIDNDDYYNTGRTDCYDTRRTPYLVPQLEFVLPYPVTYVDYPIGACVGDPNGSYPSSEVQDAELWVLNVTNGPITVYALLPGDESAASSDIGGSTQIGEATTERIEILTIEAWDTAGWDTFPLLPLLFTDSAGTCLGLVLTPNIREIAVFWVGAPKSQ